MNESLTWSHRGSAGVLDILRPLLGGLILLSLGAGIIWESDGLARDDVMRHVDWHIREQLEVNVERLQRELDVAESVFFFMAGTPSLRKYVDLLAAAAETDAADGNAAQADSQGADHLATLEAGLEKLFVGIVENTRLIWQIRLVGLESEGRELIRVETRDGVVQVIGKEALQAQGQRNYVTETLSLPARTVRYSQVELNREDGVIDEPPRATLRGSMPLYDSSGRVVGALVVNYDAALFLQAPDVHTSEDLRYFILNGSGDFLVHPDMEKTFRFEYGAPLRWDDLYPQVAEKSWSPGVGLTEVSDSGGVAIAAQRSLDLGDATDATITVALSTAPVVLQRALSKAKRRYLSLGFAALLFCALFSVYLYSKNYRARRLALTNRGYWRVIAQTKSGVMALSTDGEVMFCNTTGLAILGLKEEEIVGKRMVDVLILADHGDAAANWLEPLIEQGGDNTELTVQVESRLLELDLNVAPILGDKPKDTFYALVFNDNAEKIARVRRNETAKNELERLVVERTEQLERSRNLAMSASQIKTEFIANISHELRTPLHGIFGSLRLLRQDALNERQRHRLMLAEESMSELTEVINGILDISKLEADKLDMQETDLALPSLIHDVAHRYAGKAELKGLTLNIEMSGVSNQLVYGDYKRIVRIFSNLLDNAIRFTGQGEVNLIARTRKRGDHELVLVCEVADTGPGISEAIQAKLFDAFYRGNQEQTASSGGLGLGLAVAQQLCRLMGGDLKVIESSEQGARFEFVLRLALVGNSPDAEEHEFNPLQGKGVLIALPGESTQAFTELLVSGRGGRPVVLQDLDALDFEDWRGVSYVIVDLVLYLRRAAVFHGWLDALDMGKSSPRVLVATSVNKRELAARHDFPDGVVLLEAPITRVSLEASLLNARSDDERDGIQGLSGELSADQHARIWDVLPSLSVLIVDDNIVNQKVVGGLLEEYGTVTAYASDGQQAIDTLLKRQSELFDVVIMDCQMPVMDGYEATRRIRSGAAGDQYTMIPIIAVTAGAMGGDRLKCIESGMTDYLTKPIEPNELELTIVEVLLEETEDHDNDSAATLMPQEVVVPSTANGLEREVSLKLQQLPDWDVQDVRRRMMGKMDIVNTIVDLYLQVAPDILTRIDVALSTENYRNLRNSVHELKGMAENLGARKMGYLAYEVEMAVLDRRLKDILYLINKLKLAYDELSVVLNEHTNTASSSDP